MARFSLVFPNEVVKELEEVDKNLEKIFGEMCTEAAEVVRDNVVKNMKKVFKTTESLEQGLRITKVYHTKDDDAINVKIGFYGYDDDGKPIPLKALAREYGTSSGEQKKPFFRKAFKRKDIEGAMIKVQNKYLSKE